MRNTTKRTYIILFLIGAFFIGLGIMLYTFIINGDTWVSDRGNSHIYSYGELTVAGTIYDRNGQILVATVDGERVYNEDSDVRKATLHVVGDSAGYISTGVQTLYRSNLVGYNFIDGIYKTLSSDEGCDIRLTIDTDVSKAAYDAMDGDKGTVVVYNYKTGETICMVSAPTYDVENEPENMDGEEYNGVYLNRAISGVFTPGSTFKIITTIAAIENLPDLYSKSFHCNGSYKVGTGEVICNGVHGTVDIEEGLNASCNCVFADLANEVGRDVLQQTVRNLGFGRNVIISKAEAVSSTFDVTNATPLDLGWAGIGQFTTLINPCQMLMLMGAIANDGIAMTPYLVEESSEIVDIKSKQNTALTLSPETAAKVKALMRSNVENYYGDRKFPDLEMCGKTGSAEVVDDTSHAWFVGFSQRSDFPYAIVVCLENGGTGYSDAIPVANATMQALAEEVL